MPTYKSLAYDDHINKNLNRQGFMSCFCMSSFKANQFNPLALRKIKWTDVGGVEEDQFCFDWVQNYSFKMFLKYSGPMVVIVINLIVPMTFKKLSVWERQ